MCDKPIALTWDDIEDYKKFPVLVDDYEYYMQGGEKVYNIDELNKFIEDVANGIDNLKEERNKIKLVLNYSDDGKNAKRVVDYIMKKIEV